MRVRAIADPRFKNSYQIVALLVVLSGAPTLGHQFVVYAQDLNQQPPQARASVGAPGASLFSLSGEDYRIGPGDLITVRVEKADELSQTFQVDSLGTISMNFIGTIEAAQKTPQELQSLIADRLRGRYLKKPYVTVTVVQYNSRTFFIQGAVRSAGVYQVGGRPSLLTLITLAGGLDQSHGGTAYIIRKAKPDKNAPTQPGPGQAPASGSPDDQSPDVDGSSGEHYEMIKVNIEGMLKGNFAQNVPIEPGDLVNIPHSDVFFVAGEVRKPGSFPLKQGTTLRQAISLAEGTVFKANPSHGVIFREDPLTGKRNEIAVDIAAVMKGKQEDMPIMPNDVVVVPNSRFKSITSVILNGPVLGSVGLMYR